MGLDSSALDLEASGLPQLIGLGLSVQRLRRLSAARGLLLVG